MTPHDTPLPAWVSVDQLGSWDQFVRDVELWPDVVAEASHAQRFLRRDPARVLAFFALRIEFEALVAQRNAALTQVVWPRVPTGELVALLRRFVCTPCRYPVPRSVHADGGSCVGGGAVLRDVDYPGDLPP